MHEKIHIYHITHVKNLDSIIQNGRIYCDRKVRSLCPQHNNVGHSHIKERRLQHSVRVAQKGTIGDYVPFYFCPRSVMLYVLHKGHTGYSEGQESMVYLVSSVWIIKKMNRPCFWTDKHADLGYANQCDVLEGMEDKLDWDAINNKLWKQEEVKAKKQAEFLIYDYCPFEAIEKVVVNNHDMAQKVKGIMEKSNHQPEISVDKSWYY